MEGIDKEGAAIIAALFNVMDHKQKVNVGKDWALRVGSFMQDNGYRLVFGRWYLQADPRLSLSDALLEYDDDPRYQHTH